MFEEQKNHKYYTNVENYNLPQNLSFATDNCVTHHARNDRSLFVGIFREIHNAGTRGVGGIAVATGIGTIHFTLTNEDGITESIILKNVVYLPE